MQVGDAITVATVFGVGDLLLQPAKACVTVEHKVDRRLRRRRHLLGDVRDHPAGRSPDLTAFTAQLAEDHREQAGLAAAVCAGQAGLLPRMDLEGRAFEQQARAAAEGDVVELQHGIRAEVVVSRCAKVASSRADYSPADPTNMQAGVQKLLADRLHRLGCAGLAHSTDVASVHRGDLYRAAECCQTAFPARSMPALAAARLRSYSGSLRRDKLGFSLSPHRATAMAESVTILDVVAMLGLFIAAFFLWVSWEMITGRKALALLLAIGTFVVSWMVAGFVGAVSPFQFLIVEVVAAVVIFRVAKTSAKSDSP